MAIYNPSDYNMPDAPKIATSYAPGTAYNPQYGNALNTTATSTVPVASTTPVVSGPSDGNGGGGGGKDSKLPDNNGVIPFIPPTNTGPTGPAGGKKVSTVIRNADGSTTTYYDDGSKVTEAAPAALSTPAGQNALTLLTSVLAGYGIDTANGAVSNAIMGLIQKNYDAQTIQSLIQDPNAAKSSDPSVVALANAWNTRFSGNVVREAAGLTPLDTATYIATENSYKSLMLRSGLPAATITNDYIGKIIGNVTSPLETQARIDAASMALNTEDPLVLQQLQQRFGLTRGDMLLHILDPQTATPIIQQKVAASQIGAEASRQGLAATDAYSMQLAAQGITQAQAAQGFGTIANQLPGTQSLAARYQGYGDAGTVGQSLANQQFGTSVPGETPAQAEARLKRLQTQEVSQFGGSAGASTQGQSLGVANQQGVQ